MYMYYVHVHIYVYVDSYYYVSEYSKFMKNQPIIFKGGAAPLYHALFSDFPGIV